VQVGEHDPERNRPALELLHAPEPPDCSANLVEHFLRGNFLVPRFGCRRDRLGCRCDTVLFTAAEVTEGVFWNLEVLGEFGSQQLELCTVVLCAMKLTCDRLHVRIHKRFYEWDGSFEKLVVNLALLGLVRSNPAGDVVVNPLPSFNSQVQSW
jgi:hypothetical protein